MRLDNRIAIVTGAASGIGRAISRTLAGAGATVVLADRREDPREGGEPTLDLIAEAGGKAEFRGADIALWDDIDALVSETVARHGRLDIMVNNAAISTGGRLTETSEADWNRVMAVNLTGVFLGCKRAVQQMLSQEPTAEDPEARGRIVNISSQHGMVNCPGDIAYGVSKSGVVYMTRQIAVDYGKEGILCNAVAPGKIITGKGGRSQDPDMIAYSEARTALPRLGRPDDVAGAVLFLASPQARYITGENLMVDGGWMAG